GGGRAGGARLDRDLTRLGFHQPPRDRQPEPDPAAIRIVRLARGDTEELLEHALAQLGVDAGAFVADPDPHQLVVGRRGVDGDRRSRRRILARVVEPDVDHFSDRIRICRHGRYLIVDVDYDVVVAGDGFGALQSRL